MKSRKPITFYLDEHLALQFEMAILDPRLGKGRYGARSKILESLVRQWLADQAKKRKEIENTNVD